MLNRESSAAGNQQQPSNQISEKAQPKDDTRPHGDSIGKRVVDEVHRLWAIDDEWCVWEERGFSWWCGKHRQRVWAEPGREDDGITIWRVCVETDVVRDVEADASADAVIAALGRQRAMEGLVFDPETRCIVLHTSVYVHEQTAQWLTGVLAHGAILQPVQALALAGVIAERTGGEKHRSAHPTTGWRNAPDEMMSVAESLYSPRGGGESAWQESDEFESTAAFLNTGNCFATGGEGGLTAEFPFGPERTSMLRAFSRERHPWLGSGLLLQLHLPLHCPPEAANALVSHLNQLERRGGIMGHSLGSWSTDRLTGSYPIYLSFVPNAMHRLGLLENLALSMWRRSMDVSSLLVASDEDCNVVDLLTRRLARL